MVFDSNDGIVDGIVEFDTVESAQDWRRELLGAFRPCHPHYIPTILITTKQVHYSCIAGITV